MEENLLEKFKAGKPNLGSFSFAVLGEFEFYLIKESRGSLAEGLRR
jgi:hypothetical protein